MPSILTALQAEALRVLFENGAAALGYFLTGGTALGEYYLHHRSSDDLDLFTRSPRDLASDAATFQGWLETRGIETRSERFPGGFARFYIREPEQWFKVDVANDLAPQMAPAQNFDGIVVDSLEDIAVNKVCAFSRQEPKDCVDLYFILTETSWTLEALLQRARLKDGAFDNPTEHLRFASTLYHAGSFELPLFMRRPLDMEAMRSRLKLEAEKIFERMAPGR